MSPSPLSPLTPRQALILAYITDYTFARGIPPVLREIGDRFGIASPNGVLHHLVALERKGHIRRVAYRLGRDRRPVYLPHPFIRVAPSDRGGVLVSGTAGPVAFSHAQWVAWLREQLALAGDW